MEFSGEEVQTSSLKLREEVLLELEKNLVLCYTGKSRLSGDIHGKVTEAYKRGERGTVEAFAVDSITPCKCKCLVGWYKRVDQHPNG